VVVVVVLDSLAQETSAISITDSIETRIMDFFIGRNVSFSSKRLLPGG
jgi:hypothetical protein